MVWSENYLGGGSEGMCNVSLGMHQETNQAVRLGQPEQHLTTQPRDRHVCFSSNNNALIILKKALDRC